MPTSLAWKRRGNSSLWAAGLALACVLLAPALPGAVTNETSVSFTNAPGRRVSALAPEDIVQVRVYKHLDLETKVTLDASGMVSLPLLGQVKLGGLTAEKAAKVIRDLYEADYLVDPQVTVSVVERAKYYFTVLGQVTKPGVYELPTERSLNILQGVATAGGFNRLAAPSKVTLQRTEAGQPKILKLDLDAMAKDKKLSPLELRPDDVITVGERLF